MGSPISINLAVNIAFLNINMIMNDNGSISTNWFRKSTYSGRHLKFCSKHLLQQKLAIIRNLVDFAILLSDKKKLHNDNLKTVKHYVFWNNFPQNIINKQMDTRIKELNNRNKNPNSTNATEK